MTNFRRKPLIVKAEQYSLQKHISTGYVPEGIKRVFIVDEDGVRHETLPRLLASKEPIVADGDWIIEEPNGKFSVCSDEDFKYYYEQV